MYIPKQFEETRIEVLHDLMRSHPFGSLVTLGSSELIANHIPFLVDATPGPFGVLRGHVAKANPVWKEFSTTMESIVIFQGPEHYISPSWYPSKLEHGKVVPTWNYAVVHAYGFPKAIEDPNWLLNLVNDLTDLNEASQGSEWKVSDAPSDFVDKLIRAIVGIEIPIAKINGKWKMSQNLKQADRQGVVEKLESQNKYESDIMAELVRERLDS